MKEINIIGMGMSEKTLTAEALELIIEADILIGDRKDRCRKNSYPSFWRCWLL